MSSLAAIPLRYQGVSSRLTYSFKDTYMMDVNFGYTGSENFQPGKQYGFFPSLALGWSPTNYILVKNSLPWLNFFSRYVLHTVQLEMIELQAADSLI